VARIRASDISNVTLNRISLDQTRNLQRAIYITGQAQIILQSTIMFKMVLLEECWLNIARDNYGLQDIILDLAQPPDSILRCRRYLFQYHFRMECKRIQQYGIFPIMERRVLTCMSKQLRIIAKLCEGI